MPNFNYISEEGERLLQQYAEEVEKIPQQMEASIDDLRSSFSRNKAGLASQISDEINSHIVTMSNVSSEAVETIRGLKTSLEEMAKLVHELVSAGF